MEGLPIENLSPYKATYGRIDSRPLLNRPEVAT